LRVLDVLQAFPIFVLALGLAAAAGPGEITVIAVATFLNAPVFIRLTRSSVLSIRGHLFVEAARCIGNSDMRVVRRHILPNALGPALAGAPGTVGGSILLTAGLSFVGAGVRLPTPEWGSMIATGAPLATAGAWWAAVFPGVALGLTVLGYVLLADSLRDLLDPLTRADRGDARVTSIPGAGVPDGLTLGAPS
jgi:peptide/nickel transport system permease protein